MNELEQLQSFIQMRQEVAYKRLTEVEVGSPFYYHCLGKYEMCNSLDNLINQMISGAI